MATGSDAVGLRPCPGMLHRGELIPVNQFGKRGSQRRRICRGCANAVPRPQYDPVTTGVKTCQRCHCELPVAAFSRRRRSRDGLCAWCKSCMASYQRQHRAEPGRLEWDRARWRRNRAERQGGAS
jgi:hypothetical protein